MTTTTNLWGTKIEQNLTETVALFLAFNSVAGVQGIEAQEATEKQFSGEQFDDAAWASI